MAHKDSIPHDSQRLDVEKIRTGVAGLSIGGDIRYVPVVDSTNRMARDLSPGSWQHGTLIFTDFQKAGRGRRGRAWVVPPGAGLLCSALLVLDPRMAPTDVTMMASLAVMEAIQHVTQLRSTLKWPNDVLLSGQKVCGILAESSMQAGVARAVLGMGINVNVDREDLKSISGEATSLQLELRQRVSREEIGIALVKSLDMWYRVLARNPDVVYSTWASRLDIIDRPLLVTDASGTWQGTGVAVKRDGGLLVRRDDGEIDTVLAADVSIRTGSGLARH